MDNNEILIGRPCSGCAILVNDSIKCKFDPIQLNKIACGSMLTIGLRAILLFNVYMPCATAHNVNNHDIYSEVLSKIQASCNVQNIDFIIIGGGFNSDLARTDSPNTHLLNSFVTEEDLSHCISNVQYTYESDVTVTESIIYNFIVSQNVSKYMLNYISFHGGNNLSDLAAILLTLDINSDHVTNIDCRHFEKRAKWDRATKSDIANYKMKLHDVILKCRLVHYNVMMCSVIIKLLT